MTIRVRKERELIKHASLFREKIRPGRARKREKEGESTHSESVVVCDELLLIFVVNKVCAEYGVV